MIGTRKKHRTWIIGSGQAESMNDNKDVVKKTKNKKNRGNNISCPKCNK